ncbi:alpha/beta hydrolase [Methylocella sp.]|uniref:alpha/beta hydrolase n=1 Tax=Methylocella sp. TaxID=1978226 RepID=UPI00378382E9
MAAMIDGPRLAAKSRTAKQLVVFLHGYGADGNDLIALGQQWQAFMPDAAFVSPHAPEPCVQSPGGRQWFGLTMRDPAERWTGVNKAGPTLDAFLDAELERHGLDDSRLALVGFSQGTMMALHVGLRRKRAPAAVLGYSGELVGPERLEALAAEKTGKPPAVLLVHGSEDEVISPEALFLSGEALAAAGVPCQWHFSVGLGHGIDGAGLRHGGLFLANSLKIRIDPKLRARL